jgi:hypothetical protein
MAFAVDCRDSDAYIMPTLSKKKEEEGNGSKPRMAIGRMNLTRLE